ncbi:MAG TPA: hypothetical protein DF613_01690 [Lachnospiraceae bacterium]|nr:hypothetical protein [Lachnospiraceae bacterium]
MTGNRESRGGKIAACGQERGGRMREEQIRQQTDVELSVKERLCFAFGDLGYQCVFFWVSSFLMIFYTDVFIIPASAVSVLMLVVRLYDAVNDPIIGSMMDRTHGRMGRYRPWILAGGLGLLVSVVFMFWAHPDWSDGGKILYMYVTYIVVVTFSTMFYMAYMALNGCISTNSMERARASSWRMVMSYAGMLAVGYAAPYMIGSLGGGNAVYGYLASVLVCGIVAVPLILATGLGTHEVVCSRGTGERIPMRQQWNALLKNRPMLILLVCMTAHGVQMNGRMTVATYYCTYIGTGAAVLAIFNLLNSLAAVAGCVAAPWLFRVTGHKGRASSAVLFICALAMAGQYFTTPPGIPFYLLVTVTGFCYGAFSSLMFSMIPDAVDYAQAEYGVRVDGFLNAVASFGFKAGGAVGTSLIGLVLSLCGYVAGGQQSAACMNAINLMMTVLPGLLCLLAALCLLGYTLDRKKQNEIIGKLVERDVLR